MADFLDDINDLSMAKAIISEQRGLIEKLESICIHAYVGLGASHDLPLRFLDVLCDPVEATQEQVDALLPVDTSPPVAKLDRVRELIQARIVKYDSDMEGADADEFFKAEWAAGAMRDLLLRFDLIMSDATANASVTTCKCSFRIKMVGDGCPACNPEYWADKGRDND